MNKKTWSRVKILCPSDVADELAFQLAEDLGVGVEVTDNGVCFYLQDMQGQIKREFEVRKAIDKFLQWHPSGLDITFTTDQIADEDWAQGWKTYFKPLRVGEHLVICPTWEDFSAAPPDKVVRIDPGMAFGTGHHETTRMCLEWLEECSEQGSNVSLDSLLDVGTGSGILAITAALLGFKRVVGIDTDPDAIEIAKANAKLNGFESIIDFFEGSPSDVRSTFESVVANIQSMPLIAMAPCLVNLVAKHGTLGLSGILTDQVEDVVKAYEAAGLKLVGSKTAGEWCMLIFE